MKRLLTLAALVFSLFTLSACQRMLEEHTVTITGTIEDFTYELEPEGPVKSGSEVDLTLVSHDEAYAFSHWFDVNRDAILSEDSSVTFTVEEDKEIRAVFEKIPQATPYEVTLASNLSRAEFNLPQENEFLSGEEAELSVHDPEDYYPFLHWEDEDGDILSEEATFILTVDKAYELTAVFDLDHVASYEVTLASNLSRAEFNLPTENEVLDGEEIEISVADPEDYYPFLHWEDAEGDILSEEATFILTVDKAYELTAVFDTDYVALFDVTLSSNLSRAEFNLSTENEVLDGEEIEVSVTDPEDHYPFLHWEDGEGNILSTEATFMLTVSGNIALRAVFDLDYETYSLTLSSNLARAEFNLPLNTEHEAGEELTVSAEDPEGIAPFLHWEDGDGNIVSDDETFQLTLTEDMQLEAVYDTNEYMVEISSNLPFANLTPETPLVVEAGKTIQLSVDDPSGHYPFLRWEDGDGKTLSTDATHSVRILADATFHAVYEIDEDEGDHTVSLDANIDGVELSFAPMRVYLPDGESVGISAPEVEGYRFEYWLDKDFDLVVTTQKTYAFEIFRNRSFQAVYIEEDRYGLYLNSNVEDAALTKSADGPYDLGETVHLEASAPEGYLFKHWLDYFRDEIVSTEENFAHTVTRSRHLVAVYQTLSEPETFYWTGFESATKTAYAAESIYVEDRPWHFADALVGTLASDLKEGNRSVRIRQGFIETEFPVHHVEEVRFLYGTFGSDSHSTFHFEFKEADGDWTVLASFTTTGELQQAVIPLDVIYSDHDVLLSSPLHFRIRADENTSRVNIDNFEITNRSLETPPIPQDALKDDFTFPNNSDRLDMTLDLGMYYSYGDSWEGVGCTVMDTLTGDPVECFIYGELDTGRLGEQTLIYYAIDEEGRYVSETITKAVFRDASLLEMDFSDIANGYYDGLEGLYGDDLREALETILRTTVTYQSYGEARYILQETDADPDNPDNIILIYTRLRVPREWDGGQTWNREHVWPNRRFPGDRESNLGSDLHNLVPADPGENSSRGYKYFTDTTTGSTYAPPDEVKGDVARMMFYMDVMYADLTLVSGFANADNYEMGDLDFLLAWHFFDEVSDFESNRNDIIFSYQGNRNPFIDIPELVELLWYDHPALVP